MNYAEDRLDRRARHVDSSSKDGLWQDYQQALASQNHTLLARTLRDVGWCRHAAFHYGMAWDEQEQSSSSIGDYAQMLEFAGVPELAVLALLYHQTNTCRRRRPSSVAVDSNETPQVVQVMSPTAAKDDKDPSWLRQNPPPTRDCGCRHSECGRKLSFLPDSDDMQSVIDALEQYDGQCQSRMANMPRSYSVLVSLQKSKSPYLLDCIPEILQFWKTRDDFGTLEPVLQLLLVKLLYVTMPALAAEAVVHLQFESTLAQDYKSHWAYYVMIRALVLGERIKPHRRVKMSNRYHVPVWDLVWDTDRRLDRTVNPEYLAMSAHQIQWGKALNLDMQRDWLIPPTQWSLPSRSQYKPLFVVGDSHVLSISWTIVFLPNGEPRQVIPLVVTGLKAWHTRKETCFFTHSLLHSYLSRLLRQTTTTILLSAGEIDCREGIGGPLLEGYNNVDYQEHVYRTVQEYTKAVSALATQYSLQILVLPVAPHAHRSDRNGKATGRAFRRRVMQAWNDELRSVLPLDNGVFLLDYEKRLRHEEPTSSVGYVLNPLYNLDGTHTNSAILPHLEAAIEQCGCNLSLL